MFWTKKSKFLFKNWNNNRNNNDTNQVFLGLASSLKSILANAVEVGYPRVLFVRRTVEARANRPMKDLIHWILYEELRFILSGEMLESELQQKINSFLCK